jgi:hypothetical protein
VGSAGGGPTSLATIDLTSCGLSSQVIDKIIQDIASQTSWSGTTLKLENFSSTNSFYRNCGRTSSSQAAFNNLTTSRGFTITTTQNPISLTSTLVTSTSATISWSIFGATPTNYSIRWRLTSSSTFINAGTTVTTTTFNITGLSTGNNYTAEVVAIYGTGNSAVQSCYSVITFITS